MLLIRIENWPEKIEHYQNSYFDLEKGVFQPKALMIDLRQACIEAKIPSLGSNKNILVVLGGKMMFETDTTLVIQVTGLLKHKSRHKNVRYRLANSLAKAARKHLQDYWKIEVMIVQFDTEEETYVVLGPEKEACVAIKPKQSPDP